MHKLINKVVAVLAIIMMTGMNFLTAGVYAANEIGQNSATKEENVKFNATINDKYEAELNIDGEATLDLAIEVLNTGYLKDAKVSIEDGNYILGEVKDENIVSIKENEIELNEINSEENGEVKIQIPIKFNKEEAESEEDFNRESKVKLNAVYVNERGKEKKIEKTLNENVKWNKEAVEEISQKLVRYIKYENKTLVSFEVSEGIKDNSIPVKSKELSIIVPKINNKEPIKTIVTGDEISYKYENGVLTIAKQEKADEKGKYSWNSKRNYAVTYIYEAQTDSETISSQASAEATTIRNQKIAGTDSINSFEVKQEIGSLVGIKAEGTSNLNKGYMYTSTKRENNKIDTNYNVNYQINVGYAEVIDTIELAEMESNFVNEEDAIIKNANDNLKINKVSAKAEQLKQVLGEDGAIKIKDENGNEIAVLNKNNVEQEITASRITVETSKPQQEGVIDLKVEKSIKGDGNNSKEEIASFKKLNTSVESKGFSENQEISKSQTVKTINLEEPTSKASINVSTDRLSTVVNNEKVIFNVVLNKTDISDALYTNPSIRISLPEQVVETQVTSAKVLYEEELNSGNIVIDGKDIILNLGGTQTQYNTSTTTKGTLIRLETNLKLNNLAPTSTEKIQLHYYNEYTGEVKTAEKEINIIAPTGFVTTNSIAVDDKNVTAVDNDAELVKIKTNQPAKLMQISANLVNNLGIDANGFVLLGRVPSNGNKTAGGADLNSNMNLTLAGPIQVTGLDDAVVYYSNNVDENVDNGNWGTEATAETKSFKIVKNNPFTNRSGASFTYYVNIPENVQYEQQAKENYGIYYNNDAQDGVSRNLVESKIVGLTTGTAPDIKLELSAVDTNEGYAIDNNGTVKEGQYITYRAKVSNTGTNDAHNVVINSTIPQDIALVNFFDAGDTPGATNTYRVDYQTKNINKTLETLKGGESYTFEYMAVVNQRVSTILEEDEVNISTKYDVEADILDEKLESQYTVKNTEGNLSLKLVPTSTYTKSVLGQKVSYKVIVSNVNYNVKNNVVVNVQLPAGIKYTGISTGEQANYNERNNVVSINVGTIDELETKRIVIDTENNSEETGILKIQATATCNESREEAKSNIIELNNEVPSKTVKASQTTNISSGATDQDTLEFYIDIENSGNTEQSLRFNDEVPSELFVTKYTISVDGQLQYEGGTNYIDNTITIPAGKTAKVVITTDPYYQDNGQTASITNKPVITGADGREVNTNEATVKLTGTREITPVEENTSAVQEVEQEEEKLYKISGTAWYDENKNGKKEISERKLSGITLKLYNNTTKEIVRDSNNNELTTTSNNDGEYSFSNIKAGEYIVVAEYNNEEYELASYKVDGAEESSNSDFVAVTLDNREVAATDVIKATSESIYSIDLGLTQKEKFDLSISNNISKITVVNPTSGTKEYNYKEGDTKHELTSSQVRNSTLLVEYDIKVTNTGNVSGYAKSVVNYIPQGMEFNSELNNDWYLSKDGNLYTISLANEKLNPGETKNLKLVLVKKVAEDELGIIRGKAEIESTYNEKGLAEINALSSNKLNISGVDLVILKRSNLVKYSAIGISLGLTALIGLLVYIIKKYVDKTYNIDLNM